MFKEKMVFCIICRRELIFDFLLVVSLLRHFVVHKIPSNNLLTTTQKKKLLP